VWDDRAYPEQSRQHDVALDGFAPANLLEIHTRARRWLSADWPPASAVAALCEDEALIARGGGRLLRCSSFYEDFVKTVLTINTSWSSTCRMAAALVTEPGDGAFPSPEAVLDYGEARLRERAKLGFGSAMAATPPSSPQADHGVPIWRLATGSRGCATSSPRAVKLSA